MTLHEVAQRLGVDAGWYSDTIVAHLVLAKLPQTKPDRTPYFTLNHYEGAEWFAAGWGAHGRGTFTECVVALAERYLEQQ